MYRIQVVVLGLQSTGEMRNHQALKAHYDGKKSHSVDSMTLFGRLPLNQKNMNVKFIKEVRNGYFIIPIEGITIEIQCGFNLIHCCLKRTVHLADNTRNTCNWSRVHGL